MMNDYYKHKIPCSYGEWTSKLRDYKISIILGDCISKCELVDWFNAHRIVYVKNPFDNFKIIYR